MIPITIIDPTNVIQQGIRDFVSKASTNKNIKDEFDLFEALDVLVDFIKNDSVVFLDKKKWRSNNYHGDDIRGFIEEYLFGGTTQSQQSRNRRDNTSMFKLVIDPLLVSFSQFSHTWLIANIDKIVEMVKTVIVHPA